MLGTTYSNFMLCMPISRFDHELDTKKKCALGFVPLPGMVGYGASVWDLLPTYPPRLMEHGAPGGPSAAQIADLERYNFLIENHDEFFKRF
jgi:hypothetical protein